MRLAVRRFGLASLHPRTRLSSSLHRNRDDLVSVDPSVIDSYANKQQTGVTLRQMFQLGQRPSKQMLMSAAQFLHNEMPIRIAKRVRDLKDLPFGLPNTPDIKQITDLYLTSFAEVISYPRPATEEQEVEFTELVKQILTRHQTLVISLAQGMRQSFSPNNSRQRQEHFLLQEFLDRFNMARIGLRMIMAQHVALHNPRPGFVGVIDGACSPHRVLKDAIEDASHMCRNIFGIAPEVVLTGKLDLTFRYVPAHLRYMLFELLKNAMRATIEFHGLDANSASSLGHAKLPVITAVLAEGEEDVIIKISDRGGGIKREDTPMLFTYSYSSSARHRHNSAASSSSSSASSSSSSSSTTTSSSSTASTSTITNAPPILSKRGQTSHLPDAEWLRGSVGPIVNAGGAMFGDGFGLPMSRLYARYFGGDLRLFSMHGYGTDCYLYLSKLGGSDEVLPD